MVEGFEANVLKPGMLTFVVLRPVCNKETGERYTRAFKSCTKDLPEDTEDLVDDDISFHPNTTDVGSVFSMGQVHLFSSSFVSSRSLGIRKFDNTS